MADKLVTIAATKREQTGKSAVRKIRKNGEIPANLIGGGKATSLQLNPKLLGKAFASGKKFNLEYEGTTKPVLIKEVEVHRVKRVPLHVDLMYCE